MTTSERELIRFLENVDRLHPLPSGAPHPMAAAMLTSGMLEPADDGVASRKPGKLRLTEAGRAAVAEAWDLNREAWAPAPVIVEPEPVPPAEEESP
jgi:hypothetical protein